MTIANTVSVLQYDVQGQLKTNQLGSQRNSSGTYTGVPLETLNHEYNIRGWLLGVNRAYVRDASTTNATNSLDTDIPSCELFTGGYAGNVTYSNTNYFGFDLGYDKTSNNLINGLSYAAAQYNGNITGTVWKSANDSRVRKYDFTYDAANRLLTAGFNQYTNGAFNQSAGVIYDVSIGYDPNGNIATMNQMGLLPNGTSGSVDQLTYYCIPGKNKLQQVIDQGNYSSTSTLGDFKYAPGAGQKTLGQSTDYTYDANGNLISDVNKGITGIQYNYLNLPQTITISGKGTITYTYDATGNKLQKQTVDNTNSTTTTVLYMGGAIYQNNILQFMSHEDGRIRANSSNTGYIFDYFLKDQLGNTRMVLTDDNTQVSPILETTHYYPFGLTMKEISMLESGKPENKFKYSGKELQHQEFSDGSGLEFYDYGSRFYDIQIGRWNQIDPLTSKPHNLSFSPYCFVANNPIIFIDVKGQDRIITHYTTYEYGNGKSLTLSRTQVIKGSILNIKEKMENIIIGISMKLIVLMFKLIKEHHILLMVGL